MKNLILLIMSFFVVSSLSASQCKIDPTQDGGGTAFTKKEKNDLTIYDPQVGMNIAKKTAKPIMTIVAASNCPAWKQFSGIINNDKSEVFKILATKFVVVGVNSYDLASYPHIGTDMSPTIFLMNEDFEVMADELKGVPKNEKQFAQWLNEFAKWYKAINQ